MSWKSVVSVLVSLDMVLPFWKDNGGCEVRIAFLSLMAFLIAEVVENALRCCGVAAVAQLF